jgi:hypothetical protein
MPAKRQLHQSDSSPFSISPKRLRNAVNLLPMPPPIEVPPDLLPASDKKYAQKIITASGDHESTIPPPLLQHDDDPLHISDHKKLEISEPSVLPQPAQTQHDSLHDPDEDKSTVLARAINNHCELLSVDESHSESASVKIATEDSQAATTSSYHLESEVIPPALHRRHEFVCITIDEDEDEDEDEDNLTESAPLLIPSSSLSTITRPL